MNVDRRVVSLDAILKTAEHELIKALNSVCVMIVLDCVVDSNVQTNTNFFLHVIKQNKQTHAIIKLIDAW